MSSVVVSHGTRNSGRGLLVSISRLRSVCAALMLDTSGMCRSLYASTSSGGNSVRVSLHALLFGLEPMFAAEAKERMLKGVRDPRVNSPQGDHGKARDLAADVVSVSPRMVEYAKTIKRDTPLSFQCSPRASCIFPNWEFCISRLTTLCTTPNRSPISSCVQPS